MPATCSSARANKVAMSLPDTRGSSPCKVHLDLKGIDLGKLTGHPGIHILDRYAGLLFRAGQSRTDSLVHQGGIVPPRIGKAIISRSPRANDVTALPAALPRNQCNDFARAKINDADSAPHHISSPFLGFFSGWPERPDRTMPLIHSQLSYCNLFVITWQAFFRQNGPIRRVFC